MEIIDSHCHLDLPVFDADRDAVLQQARAAGVGEIIVPGVQADGFERLRRLCADDSGLHPAFGLHPLFPHDLPGDLQRLDGQLRTGAVAVGEIGLDYYHGDSDRAAQQALFEAQLEIAMARQLPLLLHVRKAHDAVLATLRRLGFSGGGIAHAFNGSEQQAQRYIELGFLLGFGGMLTFERSRKLRRLAAGLPLSSIALETDAPDMTVASHHGQRNSPAYLPQVLDALAQIRGMGREAVAAATTANVHRVLRLDN